MDYMKIFIRIMIRVNGVNGIQHNRILISNRMDNKVRSKMINTIG